MDDQENTTDHILQLSGLSPGTTCFFRVSNRHAIDGDNLAVATGSFTTDSPVVCSGCTPPEKQKAQPTFSIPCPILPQ